MMLTLESPSSSYSAHSLSLKSIPSNIVSLFPTPLALKSTPIEKEEKHKKKEKKREKEQISQRERQRDYVCKSQCVYVYISAIY